MTTLLTRSGPLVLVLLLASALAACDSDGPDDPPPGDLARVVVSGTSFALDTGVAFTPWGYNYTPSPGSLLEDAWTDDAAWATIEEDFREMTRYGANVVRVHLQFAQFMDAPTRPRAASLDRFRRLLGVAERTGVYLDVTGLGAYRKSDQPAWYDALSEADRWAAQAVFWNAVATVGAESLAVFCYDLMNEPVVLAPPQDGWLPGDGFGGFFFIQSLTRDLGDRDATTVYRNWIRMQAAAVRRADPGALVTVGFLPLGDLHRFEGDLDFLATHIYPQAGEVDASVEFVQRNTGPKPLLVEEIFPLAASQDETLDFIRRVEGTAAGQISQYDGRTPEQLDAEGTIGAAIRAAWYRAFSVARPRA